MWDDVDEDDDGESDDDEDDDDDDDDAHFLREMMLTRANSMREKKMKHVQTRNQMSMNLM